MEQKTSVDTSSKKLDDSNNSPPQKRAKRQPEEKSPPSQTTSNDAATTAGNLHGSNHLLTHLPINIKSPILNSHPKTVYLILFSLRRKILFGLLRRILIQTQLEEFGTSL